MMRRLTSRSLAGTSRTLVATGTPSDSSMFSTMRCWTPRMRLASSFASRAAEVIARPRGASCGSSAAVVEVARPSPEDWSGSSSWGR